MAPYRGWVVPVLLASHAAFCSPRFAPPTFSSSESSDNATSVKAGSPFPSSSGPASEDGGPPFRNVTLKIVKDVYALEGVSVRHLGKLKNWAALTPEEMGKASLTPPGSLMNFTAVRANGLEQEWVWAYTFQLRCGAIGYEGLIFDAERVWDLEGEWSDILTRPEALTHRRSFDRPVRHASQRSEAVVRWGLDWPEAMGWQGWKSKDGGTPARSGHTYEYRDKIFSLLQRSSHAYYHFLAETLPKLLLLQMDMDDPRGAPHGSLLLDASFDNSWSAELLRLLGFPRDRLLFRQPGKVYLADWVWGARPTPLHRPYPELVQRLRAALLGKTLPLPRAGGYGDAELEALGARASRIVVVQRTGANNQHSSQHAACKVTQGGCHVREVLNMPALLKALQGRFPAREVALFDSLGVPLAEQVRIFAGARAVVGAHGAGLANAAFAPPGGAVLELLPQMLQRASVATIFWHVAACAGLQHATYVVPHALMAPDNATHLHNFRVPEAEVAGHLAALLGEA